MTETLAVPVSLEAAQRLRELAEEQGESVESLARQMLEEAADDLAGDLGDDDELRRRVADWRQNQESVPSAEVHAWLRSMHTETPLPIPKPRKA